jgi:hypothetical protein
MFLGNCANAGLQSTKPPPSLQTPGILDPSIETGLRWRLSAHWIELASVRRRFLGNLPLP